MRRFAIFAVCFSLVPALSWAKGAAVMPDLGRTYQLLSGHVAGEGMGGEFAEISTIQGVAASADESEATIEELEEAAAELRKLVAQISASIKTESDKGRKIELYEWRESVQTALTSVDKALESARRDSGAGEKKARLDEALDEAKFINKILASYLGKGDFGGTVHFKRAAFDLEVGGDVIYERIRKRLPFLGGAVRGRLRVNPGAEMISQFNELKAEYYTSLLTAAQLIGELGKKSSSNKLLKGMAQWGKDTKVIYPGQGWMEAVQILTNFQYSDIM